MRRTEKAANEIEGVCIEIYPDRTSCRCGRMNQVPRKYCGKGGEMGRIADRHDLKRGVFTEGPAQVTSLCEVVALPAALPVPVICTFSDSEQGQRVPGAGMRISRCSAVDCLFSHPHSTHRCCSVSIASSRGFLDSASFAMATEWTTAVATSLCLFTR